MPEVSGEEGVGGCGVEGGMGEGGEEEVFVEGVHEEGCGG